MKLSKRDIECEYDVAHLELSGDRSEPQGERHSGWGRLTVRVDGI